MLEKTIDINEFDNTIEAVNNLTESDAKSLLKIIYEFVDVAMTGNGGDTIKLEIVDKMSNIYKLYLTIDPEHDVIDVQVNGESIPFDNITVQ